MTNQDRTHKLREVTRDIVGTYQTLGGINRIGEKNLPSQKVVVEILEELLAFFRVTTALRFPGTPTWNCWSDPAWIP